MAKQGHFFMTDVSKRFESLVKKTYKKFLDQGTILPVKTDKGIQVGRALIVSKGAYKDIVVQNKVLYADIALNAVAIKIANLVAWNERESEQASLYDLDGKYCRYFNDSKIFLHHYHMAVNTNNEARAEIMWIRYEDAKEKAISIKEKAEQMLKFA